MAGQTAFIDVRDRAAAGYSDPAVIERFAAEVRERERLDYLYLLTVADITGEPAQSSGMPGRTDYWRTFMAQHTTLRRGLENRVYADERIAETAHSGKDPASGRWTAGGHRSAVV